MSDNCFLNLNSNVGESGGVSKTKWTLGQDSCECVEVCELGKSKLALLRDTQGIKESELLTWEGLGKYHLSKW